MSAGNRAQVSMPPGMGPGPPGGLAAGGALYIRPAYQSIPSARLLIDNCTFENNTARVRAMHGLCVTAVISVSLSMSPGLHVRLCVLPLCALPRCIRVRMSVRPIQRPDVRGCCIDSLCLPQASAVNRRIHPAHVPTSHTQDGGAVYSTSSGMSVAITNTVFKVSMSQYNMLHHCMHHMPVVCFLCAHACAADLNASIRRVSKP